MLNKELEGVKRNRKLSHLLWIGLATTFCITHTAHAELYIPITQSQTQEKVRVQGRIVDSNSKQILTGVSILINGKSVQSSKNDGSFDLEVPKGAKLSFNTIGYTIQTQVISEPQVSLLINLVESSQEISEVVVTALGIKRDQKALGYAVTTVGGEELTKAISNNWSSALTGKVAGLNISKTGGGPLGSNQIVLRGETSLTGDNEALIVIDGMVMGGGIRRTGSGQSNYLGEDSPADFGTSLADINPDDIESITVLKGPAASALYGYRGSRGAIMVTTKSGKNAKGKLNVSFNSNTAIGTINRWPDYQYEYGQGDEGQDLYYSYGQTEDGPSTYSSSSAWGPKFDGQMFYQYNPDFYRLPPPERTPWRAYENNRKDLFQADFTTTNSISVSGSNDKTSARFSYTNTNNEWIIPNMGYTRHAVATNLSNQLSEKLTLSTKVNFNNRGSDNLPNTGYNNQSYMYFVRGITPSMDAAWFENNWRPGKEGIEQTTPFSNLLDNPRTMSYDMINSQRKNHLIGNLQADYKFTDELNLMVRTGIDFSFDKRRQARPFDTYKYAYGYYKEQGIYSEETNTEFLLSYNNNRKTDYKFGANVGAAAMSNRYNRDEASTRRLIYPNQYTFANAADAINYNPSIENFSTRSIFALVNFSYKDVLFIDATSRLDWASTLASPKYERITPYYYPSVSASAILSDIFEVPEVISFWKFRATAASVGGGGKRPYLNSYTYPRNPNFPGGSSNPTAIPFEDLSFENTTSYELGTDFRMFKNRIRTDITVYKNYAYNQILETPIDPSSGYLTQIINAGKVSNKGFEFEFSGDIFKKVDGFSWTAFGNFTAFDTKIEKLPNLVDAIVLSTVYGSRGAVEARVGGRFGDLYGIGYKRNPDGDIVYKNGIPELSENIQYIGNANPTTKFGIGSQFNYKNFGFNFLFDGQFGGVGYSLTHAVLMEEGKLKKTIPGRYNGIIGVGVVDHGDGNYSPNTTVATAASYYRAHFTRDNLESNTFSTDFIKLREVRIDYSLPADVLSRLHIEKASIGLYGRDLFVFSNWPSFDPEFASLNGSGIDKGAEIAQFPSTRNIGINLSFAF